VTPVAPPPALGAIERSSDRTSMKSETSFTTSMSCMAAKRKKREFTDYWRCGLHVFQARLLYPTDDVLEQLETHSRSDNSLVARRCARSESSSTREWPSYKTAVERCLMRESASNSLQNANCENEQMLDC
jgi:hypothetical protein